ncbi:hypothetical protein P3TCK_26572 [Photobacterium profundum 3TCK]|uniref:Uncharacterized protein n=1 Tax=Photobacterium profundum 3TCK TaxID=314280 RepID=Q1Z8A7_9GAMM|nr:hypothetical protein P3TCK_26572 [Photobacterium profundum 3TCK]
MKQLLQKTKWQPKPPKGGNYFLLYGGIISKGLELKEDKVN